MMTRILISLVLTSLAFSFGCSSNQSTETDNAEATTEPVSAEAVPETPFKEAYFGETLLLSLYGFWL